MARARTYHQFKKIVMSAAPKGIADIIVDNIKDGKQREDLVNLYEVQRATKTYDRQEFADLLMEVADPLGQTWNRAGVGGSQGPLQRNEEPKKEQKDAIDKLINEVQKDTKKKISPAKLMGKKPQGQAAGIDPSKLIPSNEGEEKAPKESKIRQKRFTAAAVEQLAVNLNAIARQLNTINQTLSTQLKNNEKFAKEAAALAVANERAKREKESESDKKAKKASSKAADFVVKPAKSFLERIKQFFGNILAGSAILALLNWVKDPQNQSKIEDFKNFMTDKVPLILAGLAAFVGIGIGLKLIGIVSSIAKVVKSLATALGAGGLLGKLGLLAAGIAATLLAMKFGVDNFVRPLAFGTDKEMSDYKLETIRMARDAGLNEKTGEPGMINRRGRFVPSGKPRSPEQEEVWQIVQQRNQFFETEKDRRNDIDTRRNADIQAARESSSLIIANIKENNSTQTSRGTRTSPEGKRLIQEEKERLADQERSINEQYDQERSNPPQAQVKETNTSQPRTLQSQMFGGMSETPENVVELDTDALMQAQKIKSDPSMFKKGTPTLSDIKPPVNTDVSMILGGSGAKQQGSSSSSSANQKVAPMFSAIDVRNSSLVYNLSIYNALG